MVAHYQILERICTTAGSHLYHARCLTDNAPVLIKALIPATVLPAQLGNFQREYEALQTRNFPGLISAVTFVHQDGRPLMVLKDVAGEPLEPWLNQHRPDVPTCLRLGLELVRILAGLHGVDLIHRDIRPANFMLDAKHHQLCLLDLSLATATTGDGTTPGRESPGDWAYVSPEQTGRMHRAVDYRTDFYSLGITLYRMLTGVLPFAANDSLEWAHCHIARMPPAPCSMAPTIPEAVSDIVMKLLAKLPEDRYQSAHGLQADLARCVAQWQAHGCIDQFALGTDDVSDRFYIPRKLYGRDTETATLRAAFDGMAATGATALVTVAGYSGIGKTSLVHALREPILREHGYFISGKFDQYIRDIPYATMTQAFRALLQQLLAENEESIGGWRQRIQTAVGVNGQLIVDFLPQVECLIGPQAPVPALAPTEAQNRFRMVFQQFMTVFTRREHPLVLFLDDLQWADAASLQLIEHLLTSQDTRYLLLIAAYRDNEVNTAHPLTAHLDAIRLSRVATFGIRLMPLSVAHLNQVVADTLHVPPPVCAPLTRVIFERTEGNPFFFTQFLDALYQEDLLRHDPTDRVWRWDLAHITTRHFADNVADLMAGKLGRLSAPVRETLQLAASLGSHFELRHLALVSRLSEDEIGQRLAPAVRENLILRTERRGQFLHDRIQQAAYALLPAARHAEVHLGIGRTFMAELVAEEISEQIFDVASHLNRGAVLLIDQDEKTAVATINLRAAEKAKASAAYASACVYLAKGMELLDETGWECQYELMFKLWLERASCEFLSGNLDMAGQLIPILLERASLTAERAAAYCLKIELHMVQSENRQAVASGLACLRLFGIDLPQHPDWEQVQAEYRAVWDKLGERPIERLIDLPLMTDPEVTAAMQVCGALIPPAVYTDNHFFTLLICRMVNLSLQYGVNGAATRGLAMFGAILGPVFHHYAEGCRFGRLGCGLVERHGFVAYQAKVYFAVGLNVLWTQPIATAIEFIHSAFRMAVETGDLTMACFSYDQIVANRLLRGDPLDAVWGESEQGLQFILKAKFHDVADLVVSQQRLIADMQGRTAAFSTFSDAQFDEAAFEAQLTGDRMSMLVCRYWTLKLQARFLSGDYAAAFEAGQTAKALLWTSNGRMITLLDYAYYMALTVAARFEGAGDEEQGAWRDLLATHQDQLREWAECNGPTFGDKHALVSAQIARLEGRALDAMRLYVEAIRLARENGFVQNEAIAHELAAEFYLARGFVTSARAHLDEARSCFSRWGAEGKVRQLDARYPPLCAQPPARWADPLGAGTAQLDLISVAKASQAVSGKIVLNELIETLMRIVLENAGAQTAYLLLVRDQELILAAQASVEQLTVQVRLHPGQATPASALPSAILNYVRRSHEQVLLADAAEPHPFAADPYLARRQPKSVLCLPIVRQSTLIGMLYLENTLVTHAFTPQQVTVLELLASQAAISLENALLYTDLQQENRERKRVEDVLRERESRIRRLVESNIIGIFFWDLHGGISDANDAFLRLVGYDRQELLSGQVQWAQMTPPAYLAADARAIEELRRSGTCSVFEKEFVCKNGAPIPVLIGAALLEGSQENGVAFVLDLRERKQAEAERGARQAAEAANRAKSVFIANMSHELRTPLNGILGYAQILQRDQTLDERQVAGLNVIQQSGEHLLNLINDILDFAKIEANKLELYCTPIELPQFLRVIGQMVGVLAAKKGLEFKGVIAPDLPRWIRADEKRLRQILLNLLSNAVKFTDAGQVVLRVRWLPSARLRFETQDTGIGISRAQLEGIFEPFEQAGEMPRRLGGTGLGLAISRQFVRLMGSEIQVDSRVGQGSTFWFELDVSVLEGDMATVPLKSIVTGYEGPRKKILVVDDVAGNRAVLCDMLGPLGFEMAEAKNGADALRQAQALRPHLILMDIVMPEMSGLEAVHQLRQLSACKRVPVIAVSASASGGDEANSLLAGANAFLPKPIDVGRLLAQISQLLNLIWTYQLLLADPSTGQEDGGPLLAPPMAEMEVLHLLARKGNMREIEQWASQLAERNARYGPFASQLRKLAQGYQSRAILNLVQHHLEPDSGR